jgi:hypothetical protein
MSDERELGELENCSDDDYAAGGTHEDSPRLDEAAFLFCETT